MGKRDKASQDRGRSERDKTERGRSGSSRAMADPDRPKREKAAKAKKVAKARKATKGGAARSSAAKRPYLRGISEIRAYLRTNRTPVYFVSPTPFNLLGIDRWVRDFFFVSYYDCFEGSHPRVFVPRDRPYRAFNSLEEINNYLLEHKEVGDFVRSKGPTGKATFVMFDEQTERLAPALGLQIIHPPAALRKYIDSKTVTVRLGNEARVPSVPNVLAPARTYAELLEVARGAGLGDDLVVQTPYGDSGRTTYFLKSEKDWATHGASIASEAEVKIMQRVNVHAAAIEACITRHGTIVGPLMTDLTGYRELTPYKGGWCGNDMWAGALSEAHRRKVRKYVRRLGDRMAETGYRGFFEVDVLADIDTDELYLGEINPRVSGASPLTNVTAGAYADLPLFCFHLLEYLDVDYDIDVDDINERWAAEETIDVWSQLIIKEPTDGVELLTQTPRTGIWRMEKDGSIRFGRWGNDWHSIIDDSEAFFLRVLAPGDYRYKGADLGTLVTRARMQTEELTLTPRCRDWIRGIRGEYRGVPVEPRTSEPPGRKEPLAFKFGTPSP